MPLTDNIEAVLAALAGKTAVVITTHQRPDGDALGAALGLLRILREAGAAARMLGPVSHHHRYDFMVEPGEIAPGDPEWSANAELLVVLDCTDLDRAEEFAGAATGKIPIVNIDHHRSNSSFAEVNWIDPEASSTGEMIFRLAAAGGLKIPPAAATALWVAITTDTGQFAYENTTPGALRAAAELLEQSGLDPAAINRQLNECLLEKELRLTARTIDSLALREQGRVAAVSLSRQDFRTWGCTPENAQDLVNLPRALAGVMVGLFFYELLDEEVTKVSVRAVAPYDATKLCRHFGGGGHERAAGCALSGGVAGAQAQVFAWIHTHWFPEPQAERQQRG